MFNSHNFSAIKAVNSAITIAAMVVYTIAPLSVLMPQVAAAGPTPDIYTISAVVDSVVGTEATVSGSAHTETSSSQIHIAIDWNEDGLPHPTDGTPYDLDAAEVLADGTVVHASCTSGSPKVCNITWDPVLHDYVSAGAGTYVAYAFVYHGNKPGNDGLEVSQISTITIVIPPQCSDGADNDFDGDTDYLADDGCSSVSDDDESDDPPPPPNNPPVLGAIGNQSGDEHTLISFDANATDADDDTLIFSISGEVPSGSSFNTSTGEFSWTPGELDDGVYTVTVTVDDGNGGTDSETFDITVNEVNEQPVITLTGLNPLDLILGVDTYSELGATWIDAEDGSGSVTNITGSVNSLLIGVYEVFYNFTDSGSWAADQKTRTVNVKPGSTECSNGITDDNDSAVDYPADSGCLGYSDIDENEPPVITVTGDNPLELVVNVDSYSEQGATANDAEDGNGLPVTDIDASAVNTSAVGSYLVAYDFIDFDGASAPTAYRTVNVVSGENECNNQTDDDDDGDMDYPADSGCSSVDDPSENMPPDVVIDTELVMLTLHSVFNPPVGVHATDSEDGSVSVIVLDNPVNVDEIDDYIVTYGATDSDGASAEPETQTVKVRAECADGIDNDGDGILDENDPGCSDGEAYNPADNDENTAPVIETELLSMTLTAGDPFVMPDYTASDTEDGDVTSEVVIGGDEVDNNTPGVYEVTLDVEDSNEPPASADTVTITVTVVEALVDACPNREGVQESVPQGFHLEEGLCVEDDTTDNNPPPTTPQCADNVDSDGDNLIDLDDPGCENLQDNDETNSVPSGGGGGGGNGDPSLGQTFTPPLGGGSVLGASTAAPVGGQVLGDTVCATTLLNEYIKTGRKNNPEEVSKLQKFLNEHLGLNIPVTGFYGSLTLAAVNQFQTRYGDEVLVPWIPFGHPDKNTPTGYVYKTTKRWINMLACPALGLPVPQLP